MILKANSLNNHLFVDVETSSPLSEDAKHFAKTFGRSQLELER